ncbi:MAG: 2-amino-4-hydroxy-6-hydroxymethyldihydropteridine diphosphokinase [Acidobacteriota bacterium]
MPIYLGFGANQGDIPGTFASALAALEPALEPLTISSLYRSAPVVRPGGYAEPQAPYNNLVVRGFASPQEHPPERLLRWTQEVEKTAGRQPHGSLDAPRPLDIDLLLYGDQIVAGQDLTVPHPRMHQRRFVLAPLQELAPDLKIPSLGLSVSDLLASLAADGDWVERVPTPGALSRWRG